MIEEPEGNEDTFVIRNDKQLEMRDRFLVPFYDEVFPDGYEFLHHNDKRARAGADTIGPSRKLQRLVDIDEKIVRYPTYKSGPLKGQPKPLQYDAIAIETWSNTTTGFERHGWAWTNTVAFLLYCWTAQDESHLIANIIPWAPFRAWFFAQDPATFGSFYMKDEWNHSRGKVVPVWMIRESGIVVCQRKLIKQNTATGSVTAAGVLLPPAQRLLRP